jgi:hypothetical protein
VTVAGVPSRVEVAYSLIALSKPPQVSRVTPLVGPGSGGTPVVLLGEAFGDSAVVEFVGRDSNGTLIVGERSECVWRGVDGMGCNNTAIQCLSPPLTGAGRSFDVSVTASRSTSVFAATDPSLPSRWTYEAPAVTSVAPSRDVAPQPAPGANVTISGRNFGGMRGVVTAGLRALVCPVWTDGRIVCVQPPGVASGVNLTVTTASGLASPQAGPFSQQGFLPPAVTAVHPAVVLSGTAGGGRLDVVGVNFAHPLPMSAWLVRQQGLVGMPWGRSGPVPSPDVSECPVVPGTVTATSLACRVPPGTGTGWGLVVVNHDDAALPGFARRASLAAPSFSLAYAPPVLSGVALVAEGGGAPATGGFSLRLTGANFGAEAPLVTVGSLLCGVAPDNHTHDSLVCTAPARQVDGHSLVRVSVGGQLSEAVLFSYDPPVVSRMVPGEMLAVAPASGRPRLTLHGVNFGSRYRTGVPTVHAVRVGPLACGSVNWVDDAELSCVPEGDVPTGPTSVTISLAGDASAAVFIMAGCPANWFARLGDRCAPCPSGASCLGGVSDPVSLPGHFPLSMTEFVECAPRAACAGGMSGADLASRSSGDRVGCSRLYRGDRCAECTVGAYRLKGKCASCPDTAWLLFFGFSLVITAAVAAAVYLAGKRINMAGLSIGVVRWWAPLTPAGARAAPVNTCSHSICCELATARTAAHGPMFDSPCPSCPLLPPPPPAPATLVARAARNFTRGTNVAT